MSRGKGRHNVTPRSLEADLDRAGFTRLATPSGGSTHQKWVGPHGAERLGTVGGRKDADAAQVKDVRRAIARSAYRGVGLERGLKAGTHLLSYFVEVAEVPGLTRNEYADRCGLPRPSTSTLFRKLEERDHLERIPATDGGGLPAWRVYDGPTRGQLMEVARIFKPAPTLVEALALTTPATTAPLEDEVDEVPALAPLPLPDVPEAPPGDALAPFRAQVVGWRSDKANQEGNRDAARALVDEAEAAITALETKITNGDQAIALVEATFLDASQSI